MLNSLFTRLAADIFFPLFIHLPSKTDTVLAKRAPSRKLSLQSFLPRFATLRTFNQLLSRAINDKAENESVLFLCFGAS
jgi:hypothetical protein